MRILFFAVKKKIEKQGSQKCSEAVGEEVEPIAGAGGHDMLLYHFGQATIGNADDYGEQNGSFLVVQPVGNELAAIAPKTSEGETCIHEDMHHLVESDDGLGMGKQRSREHGQNQDDDSAQDSRDAISGESFQKINRSWLRKRRHQGDCRAQRRRSP